MTPAPIRPPAALGVIGGGQLGRMFVQAAQRIGYRTVVLAATADSPAAQVAHEVIVGPPDDLAALRALRDRVAAITVEFENVSAPALRWLARRRVVRPGWNVVRVAQDRLREKRYLAGRGFPLAPWRPVRDRDELATARRELGDDLILKTASSGYDGKGQVRVGPDESIDAAWAALGCVRSVAEGVVAFAAELSVVVARGADGRAVAYPPAWNEHDRHILDATVMPAPIGPVVTAEARKLALGVAEGLDAVGVICVEFFLTTEGGLLVNEIAPRPHNSGHLTIEAAATSQFEQQVRALCGLPLGPAELLRPAAMVNLLGDLWSHGEPGWERALAADPGLKLHLYGKRSAAPGRKMGHLTAIDDDPETAMARARRGRALLQEEGGRADGRIVGILRSPP